MRELRPTRISRSGERGLTLVELIVTVAILSILASAAVPIARFQVKRQNERYLRYDLWMMRDAIDKVVESIIDALVPDETGDLDRVLGRDRKLVWRR